MRVHSSSAKHVLLDQSVHEPFRIVNEAFVSNFFCAGVIDNWSYILILLYVGHFLLYGALP